MNKIISTYEINHQTLALLPAKQIGYDTIVVEKEKKKYVRQTTFKLIKEACIHSWSTYEGRRQAVIYHTNFKQRTPIPISKLNKIYFFPTHSPKNINNVWIAAHQIARIGKPLRHERTNQT